MVAHSSSVEPRRLFLGSESRKGPVRSRKSVKGKVSLRSQTVHSVNGKRISQQAKIRFVAEPPILLLLFDLLRRFGFHKQIPKTLYRSKSLQK